MCNVRTLTYSCSHTIPFRLSTCAGTFTYQTRKSPTGTLPSCRSFPLLTFISPQPCGACLKAAAEKVLEEKIARLRLEHLSSETDDWTAEPPEALVQAEAELASEVWRLEAFYPEQARFKKDLRPEKGRVPTRSGSLLRREVRVEDVVLRAQGNMTAATEEWDYESWKLGGFRDLGEEIAEDERERVGRELPGFGDCGVDCLEEEEGVDGEAVGEEQLDGEIGSVMDWGVATSWVLSSEGGEWDGGVVDGKVESESQSEETVVPGMTDVGLVEGQQPEQEVAPVEATCTLKENNSTEYAKAPHWQRERPSMSGTSPTTSTTDTRDLKLEETDSSSNAKAPPRLRQRPQQQKAMDGHEPFRACSPFWMEFAVSV
ncbi:hypothetical protein M409DRAFT_56397 [Zasmidium cellare ATCC 36951]|uniref:Uncharacterized protein n=1 Tax=Zasmidium cellare ATCC 36951 TaxID=1080233 RepID=A0A6A6CC09_ZASCE|nr:uncharacterized protein M409DRAFT_56397 [Zasmidium cellare ATCC 36951]KAF2164561.1 hypothetical protein M409DRAFT_56397 [Zasmidium cellare ATCC 36951]